MPPFPILHIPSYSTPFRWLIGLFRSRIHGDARWMRRSERRQFLAPRNRGITLASGAPGISGAGAMRLSQRDSFTNLALVAPTGSGKTTRYVIPNVLQVDGSVVVTDPAGEIFACTSGHLASRGFQIQTLQPADVKHSAQFNPLAFCKTPQQLRQLATLLGKSMQGQRSDPFWSTAAINLLAFSLVAIANVEDERFRNLGNLRWLLNCLFRRN